MNKKLIAFGVVLLGLLLSLFVLTTPMPNTEDEDLFNTKYALDHIAEISEVEHSVYDPIGHEIVKTYLKTELEEFIGAENVTETTYLRSEFDTEEPLEYDVTNLLGVIQGDSDTGILIVAHYDSRGHIGRTGELGNSYGAADDGYGLATLLEIARLYGNRNLENSIYILITDAEETGLYGASKAAVEPFMDDIGFVINIEARGVKGPAYMFETSVNNDKVIDFYKNADLPVSYSLATAVYTVMPNSTDFTEFLAEGKNGINFAVLDGLFYYHTPHDNYTNVNPSSIAHYGAQIIPLVEEFTTNSEYADVEYFDSNGNQVFFTVFPNVFIAYSETLGSVLHIVTIVALIGLFVFMLMTDKITVSKIVKSFAILVGLIIAVVLFGYIIANIVAWISRVPFDVTYIRTTIGGVPSFITLLLIALIVPYAYHKYTSDDDLRYSLIVGGLFINALLALLTGFALSGASFLFMIPAISMVIYLGLRTWCRKTVVKKIVVGLLLVMNIVIVLPILYSLYLALTIGGLLALNVILVFYLFTLTPLFIELYE
jgi:hypothetical protein